jgi:predicted ATPase/DNA-binding SARP family transcriptional activator
MGEVDAEFRILGPLEVEQPGGTIDLGGRNRQALLAVLLLNANELVPSEQLIEELWGEKAPQTAVKIVQNNVSQLRKVLAPGTLVTRPPGYVLQIELEQLDAARFRRLADEGRRLLAGGDAEGAAATLRQALSLWRGPALADFAYESFAQGEIASLEELRLSALEDRIEADLALGRHGELVGELESVVVQNPLRDRLRGALMLALYRSGRQAEALEVYKATRRQLVDELGIEPGPALQRLEQLILQQDASLEPPPARETPAVAPADEPEARKTVSVLFAELIARGDPERMRDALGEAADAVTRALERHGGRVEHDGYGGVLAVFGVPRAHEDDALRAVRAAVDARGALADVDVRTGISTGEVVAAGTEMTGDVVAHAMGLARAAGRSEILVGEGTERLVRAATQLEETGPLDVRGRETAAWRLLDVAAGALPIPRRLEAAMVGRERELSQLRQAFERAVHESTPYLFTVLGPPGIGKSRLATELAAAAAAEGALVLTGRCLSYGEGITFWPLAEIVAQLAGPSPRETLVRLLAGEEDAAVLADRIAGAIGRVEHASASEETFWAVRHLFETLARERPLVLVLEDLHWAEPTMLELVEHVADWARDAPIFLLCLARPELLELRPAWAGGKLNATSILLEPLSEPESATLIDNLHDARLEESVRSRILEASGGNPLFLEQMLALVTAEGAVDIPPSIHALLAARLDRLGPAEREVLQRASVVGREFEHSQVAALSPEDARESVRTQLQLLARRDLIQHVRGDSFRFRHVLIGEAAYESLPKRTRAELHARFAARLERQEPERDELIGYHLEQASRWRSELGQTDRELAARASGRLAAAAASARARGDVPAIVNLLSRAARLQDAATPGRAELLIDLAEALRETGDFKRAEEVLAEASDAAAASGEAALQEYVHLSRLRLQVAADPAIEAEALEREARRITSVFEEFGDDRRLAKAWELLAWALWLRCRAAETEEALGHAIEHASRAGDGRLEAQCLNLYLGATFFGPVPVAEGIRRCEELLARTADKPRVTASTFRALAGLTAMEGRFDEARTYLALCRAILEDLGLKVTAASASETAAIVELLAGDPAAAEREARSGYEQLEQMGETSNSADLAAILAHALHAQGELAEALRASEIGERAAAPGDLSPQVQWRTARAKVLAARRRKLDAERLAREAVSLAAESDFLGLRADALMTLAAIVRERRVIEDALRLYEQKGNLVSAKGVHALLAEIAGSPPRRGV